MEHTQEQQIERGMQLAADLPEVMPDQADARIQAVYDDIQTTLRVPFVNLIFRTLANYPEYLEGAWKELSPGLRTQGFERAADRLRARALLEPGEKMPEAELSGIKDPDTLRAFNDTIHHVLPKLLLVATAWDTSPPRGSLESGRDAAGANSAPIPLGIAEGTTKVQMVNPEEATGRIHDLFQAVKERHGHPLVSSYYRALGNWPDFFVAVWARLEPRVGSPAYEQRKQLLVAEAQTAARALPGSGSADAALGAEEREEVRAILAAFRLKFIPEMLIDVAEIKAMLDGPEAARSSAFSVASRT